MKKETIFHTLSPLGIQTHACVKIFSIVSDKKPKRQTSRKKVFPVLCCYFLFFPRGFKKAAFLQHYVHVNKPSKKQLSIFKPKKLRNHAMMEA